jgi:hypothetical protein
MEKLALKWNPESGQAYTSSFGSQTLEGESFNKAAGTWFAMYAPEQVLTLVPFGPSLTKWGGTALMPNPVAFSLMRGSLIIDGKNQVGSIEIAPYTFHKAVDYSVFLFITDAEFQIKGIDNVVAGGALPIEAKLMDPRLRIQLAASGRYEVDCSHYTCAQSAYLSDQSRMQVRSKEIRAVATYFHIADQSSALIASDNIVAPKAVFSLEEGDGRLQFDAFDAASGKTPFDFTNSDNSYPEGLFNFAPASKGQITIQGIGNAFQKSGMMSGKIVAVDGIPQSDDKLINYDWTTQKDYLVVSLKSK